MLRLKNWTEAETANANATETETEYKTESATEPTHAHNMIVRMSMVMLAPMRQQDPISSRGMHPTNAIALQ